MSAVQILGLIVVATPALLVAALGLTSLLDWPLPERAVSRIVQAAMFTGLVTSIVILAMMLQQNIRRVPIELGNWVELHVPSEHLDPGETHSDHPLYHFSLKFEFDRLSVPFVILTFILCGTIGAFADKYMHRESGFNRFFLLFAVFVLGMVVTSLAGTIETLFAGWEFVGLSSTLLVAFFQDRPNPCRNGLRVWIVYRISDAGLLIAALLMHHIVGEGDFDRLIGTGSWPEGVATVTAGQALSVGFLLVIAAAGKSALIPFSGWLPRAMEGPTPSSAVFYGALSVHLGAFLLLRVSPILSSSLFLSMVVLVLGSLTAIFASFTGRAQTDIKTTLSFASLTQVGFIVAEIGLFSWLGPKIGYPSLLYIPLIHILGHGSLRTLQFVRAPTLLHDYRVLDNAIGARVHLVQPIWEKKLGERWRTWLYHLALHRGNLDAMLERFLVRPLLAIIETLDRWDQECFRSKNLQSSDRDEPR